MFEKFCKNIVWGIFIYTESYTETHRALKISIYSTKYSQNHNLHFRVSHKQIRH